MYILKLFVYIGAISALAEGCKDGWIRHGTNCYHFSHDRENWLNAMGMCNLIGGTLVEINDAEENNFIMGQAVIRGSKFRAFIALSDVVEENVWVWMVSNTKLTNGSYSNWDDGQPNNSGGYQSCVLINPDGSWNDEICSDDQFYICETRNTNTLDVIG